ncbi:DUF445 family protein [Halobacillus locisalis]|uniref:DUF445 family protein n=1 Tax=Halobacillus locisalis TaxID=220753 RepID=A0A838CR26_9BACI|nr:DUF445 family protein [Halobacillus locisalis]MBA2174582.1 DUF445 family protein [Halobacillus locisalis]
MNSFVLILIMIGLGAIIGGVTNSLAIKMLFRPYRPIYLGKFKLPLTPGLIPKRQEELAQQLGKMVVEHLLTADGLRRKLEGPVFQNQMTTWAQNEAGKLMEKPTALHQVLERVGVNTSAGDVESRLVDWIEKRYHHVMNDYRDQPLKDLLSDEWKVKVDEGTDQAATYIQSSVTDYLKSAEGKEKVVNLIENYLENQGFFGSMISSFMGSESLADRVYPAILTYVQKAETNEWLKDMLHTEIRKMMEQPVRVFEDKIGPDTIGHILAESVAKSMPIEEWMERSVKDWTKPFQDKVIQEFVPMLVVKGIGWLSDQIEGLMESMHLSEIVQEEVNAFQLDRLEDMVLGISRREFKMITYLGALLGGAIGLLQGMIVILLG